MINTPTSQRRAPQTDSPRSRKTRGRENHQDHQAPWPGRCASVEENRFRRPAKRVVPRAAEPTPTKPKPANTVSVQVHQLPFPVTVVEVDANDAGVLDPQRVRALTECLQTLAVDEDGPAVVIDLSRVAVITAQFLNALQFFSKRLAWQNRQLSLRGVGRHCAHLLQISGVGRLIG